jgi:exodeoxyribonuclease V gamma subunit
MPLNIFHSNRVEVLHELLAQTVASAGQTTHPLAPEFVLLDNPSLGPWINLQLAMRHGIAANIRYLTLDDFFWSLARAMLDTDIPRRTPLNKQEMAWRLYGLLGDEALLARAELEPVRSYMAAGDADGRFGQLKRYQLAARVADLFDQYQVYRPDWINQYWAQGKALPAGATGGSSRGRGNAEPWQRLLWASLEQAAGNSTHRARVQDQLCRQLAADDATPELPWQRLFVFGVTAMAPGQLQLLMQLARHIDIYLYLFNPCALEWFDIRSAATIARLQHWQTMRTSYPVADPEAIEIGNPLLAGQGSQVRDFLNLVYSAMDQHLESAAIEDELLFIEPDANRDINLLASIQQDILELSYRGDLARYGEATGSPQALPGDEASHPSLHIHNCHSPLREVEVLHDQLLQLFAQNPQLMPRDVVVMMPRVAPYVPFIKAVFDSAADGQRIPYHINDLTLQEQSPILGSFETLLQAPASRVPLSEVLGLLEVPAISRRFGLARQDFELLKQWLVDSGARWGLDAQHRASELGLAYREFSWAFALDRLWAGYAMQAGDAYMPMGVMPLDEIEGANAGVFDAFLQFWTRYSALRQGLAGERSSQAWQQRLHQLLDDFYDPGDEDARALGSLRTGIDELGEAGQLGWYSGTLPLEVVQAAIAPVLARISERRHPWAEGVKFCSLLPMRGVPFPVVYLLGMNMDDYPRQRERPGFDLMRDDYRPGDRSARIDDRWLFLEALLSARQRLHISYTGQDMHRNEQREPSVVLSELIDYLRDGYQWPAGVFNESGQLDGNSLLYTRHPLQPFSTSYFSGNQQPGSPVSYNPHAYAVASAQQRARQAALASGQEESARWQAAGAADAAQAQTEIETSLDDFVEFFAKPAHWLFRRRGISLNRYETTVSDEELWRLPEGLGPWQATNNLLKRARQSPAASNTAGLELQREQLVQALVVEQTASGAWPMGVQGEKAAGQLAGLKTDYLFMLAGRSVQAKALNLVLTPRGDTRLVLLGEALLYEHPDGRPELLWQSASKAGYKHLLAFYLRAAAVFAGLEPGAVGAARIAFSNTAKPAQPGPYKPESDALPLWLENTPGQRQASQALLQELAELYMDHHQQGLPFHAEYSHQLFASQGQPGPGALQLAWAGTQQQRGIGMDSAEAAYYGSAAALAAPEFTDVAGRLWGSIYRWLGRA